MKATVVLVGYMIGEVIIVFEGGVNHDKRMEIPGYMLKYETLKQTIKLCK